MTEIWHCFKAANLKFFGFSTLTLLKNVEDLKELLCGLYVSTFTILEIKTLRETFYIYSKITVIYPLHVKIMTFLKKNIFSKVK